VAEAREEGLGGGGEDEVAVAACEVAVGVDEAGAGVAREVHAGERPGDVPGIDVAAEGLDGGDLDVAAFAVVAVAPDGGGGDGGGGGGPLEGGAKGA